ncbi:MAG: ABC transporter ATP-binding protein [Chloroflexi bacterium]|nr:ABC transporter ATP-binding protein [Chloroflexota bacterium]
MTERKQRITRYRTLLTTYLRPHRGRALLLAALLLGAIALQLANPQILRSFIDTARSGGSAHLLTLEALLFLGVAVLTQVFAVLETYLAENLGWLATNRLRADLLAHCLRLDPDFHGDHTPGELIERIDGDVTTLSNFFSRLVVYVLGNGILLVGIIALLFRVDWRIGAAMALLTGLSLALTLRIRDVAVPHWTAARQSSAELFGLLEERLAGTEDIRSSGAVPYVMRRLHERNRDLLRHSRGARLMGMTLGGTLNLFFACATALSLALGAYLFNRGAITLGAVYLVFTYTQMLNRPLEQITRQLQEFQQAGAGVARVHALLGMRSALIDGGRDDLPPGSLSLRFDHVTFTYGGNEPALRDVSFDLPAGSVLGILGRTGGGKTTLSRLVFRLHDPTAGEIRLAGVDPRTQRLATLRARVGMVTQSIQLFHASVRDNLTFFDPRVPDERIVQVLDGLGLGPWLAGLPRGLDTFLAGGAGGLSAGEAQLLAFARIFLADPGLVILDEASSRLDPATERRIEHAVDRLLAGRTGVVIAHRLATVRRADQILILDGGRTVEYGRREELERDPGSRYSAMLRTGLEEATA